MNTSSIALGFIDLTNNSTDELANSTTASNTKNTTQSNITGETALLDDSKKESVTDKNKIEQMDKAMSQFWFLTGFAINNEFDAVQEALAKNDIQVETKEEAVEAISNVFGTDYWDDVFFDLKQPLKKVLNKASSDEVKTESSYNDTVIKEESGWVEEAIAAFGQIAGGTTQAIASSKQLKQEQERSRQGMNQGLINLQIAKLNTQKKDNTGIIIVGVIVVLIVIGIMAMLIIRSAKAKE